MNVSVVVCAYTLARWELLARAVESVLAEETASQLILVIDHNDELLDRSTSTWPQAHVIANAGERGLSDARNTGVEFAKSDVIAFLDDDAAGEPGWLADLCEPFVEESVGLTAGRVLPEWALGQPTWFPDEFMWVVGCSYAGQATEATVIRNPIGASMAVRRAVFAEVGLFHDRVGRVGRNTGGCEETELAIRARRAGWTTYSAPSSVVRHYVSSERHEFRYFVRRCWSEGKAKAMVATLAGASDALEAERSYVTRALPRGVAQHLLGHRRSRIRGTVAIAAGLGITAAGYVSARLGGLRLDDLPTAPALGSVVENHP
jgi:GT2 family glycosyltransferase